MRRGKLVLVAALAMAAVFATVSLGTAMADEPKQVKLNSLKGAKGAVPFDHVKHKDTISCKKCHHTGDNKTCFSCHKAEQGADGTSSLKKAMHDSCKKCHKETVKKDPAMKDKAPVKCNGCHKK